MGVKTFKPTSPGIRFRKISDFEEITKSSPEKGLLRPLKKSGGRNNKGRITSGHKGGGSKRKYRVIDFKRNDKDGIPAKVVGIEYDPNRSANIALLNYADGEKRYILSPLGLKDNMVLESGSDADIKVGNCLPIDKIPLGTVIHNIELTPGRGAQLIRSAGTFAQLVAKEKGYAQLKLASGEVRKVLTQCRATIGQVGNIHNEIASVGKAGANRWRGVRPRVRGVAMNPVDHPHGGGEGRTSGGRHPVSPWGKPTRGAKTRKNKSTDKFIVKKRK